MEGGRREEMRGVEQGTESRGGGGMGEAGGWAWQADVCPAWVGHQSHPTTTTTTKGHG